MSKYKIIRNFQKGAQKQVLLTNLSLKEAQEHCEDPETSSSTCQSEENTKRTELYGPWFDSYQEQKMPLTSRQRVAGPKTPSLSAALMSMYPDKSKPFDPLDEQGNE